MICCLLIAALLAPFGLAATPVMGHSVAACCVNRHLLLVGAVLIVSVAALCALFLMTPQAAAPFHHICRFIAAPGA